MKIGTFPEERPLAVFALCAGAGVLAGRFLPEAPVFLCVLGITAGLGAALTGKGNMRLAALCAAVLFAFLLRSGCYFHQALPPPGEYLVTGVVREIPAVDEEKRHAAVQLRDVRLREQDGAEWALSGAYWTWYGREKGEIAVPKAGDTVRTKARLYLPSGQRNPYGFDFRRYLLERGIPVGLYNQGEYEVEQESPADLRALAARTKTALLERLDRLFGEDSALPKALLLGWRQELGEETLASFSRAGVAHVLAVSGLHVSLLAAALSLALRRALGQKGRFVLVGLFLAGYCLLLDFRASAVRASVLTLGMMAGGLRRRRTDALSALCLSFILIVFLQPGDMSSVSFQLSFGAVLGMMLLGKRLEGILSPLFGRRIGRAVSAALSASLDTVIPVMGTFHYFSLVGLVFSPLMCAVLAVLLPVYGALLLVSLVYLPLAQPLAALVGLFSRWMLRAVGWAAALPGAFVNTPAFPWPLIPFAALLLWLYSPYSLLRGRKRLAMLGAAFALGCAGHLLTIDRAVSYTQMDVGGADCAVLQDGRRTVVVDTGEDGQDLCAYLLSTGRRADLLVLTHLHMDHCGGVFELLKRNIPIGRVVIPKGAEHQQVSLSALQLMASLRARGIPVSEADAGMSWREGNICLTAVWPDRDTLRSGQDPNDYCLVLRAELGEISFLLCGDLSGTYEAYAAQPADVLKIAHHGSSSSSSEEFLRQVRPSLALISAGSERGAAAEDGEVAGRLKALGIPYQITALSGAVRIEPRGECLTVQPFLRSD